MGSLNRLTAPSGVQIIGGTSSGSPTNVVNADTHGNLQVVDYADGTPGAAAPAVATQIGGTDGTNLRTIATDTSGRTKLAGSSYFHPLISLRVQAVLGNTGGLATSLVIPITPSSSGNLIAVAVTSSVIGTVTVTDNLSQTYSTAVSGTSSTHTSYIFYKANTAAGVNSITINSTVSTGLTAIVTEYFGISASPLDKTSTGTVVGASAFSSGATATTTSATELLLGTANGITKNNQTYTAGAGWNSVGTSNGFNAGAGQIYMEDQYVTVVGAYIATGTASGNDTIISNIATFVITNPSLIAINQPKVVKSGAGILRKVIINTVGTGSPTLILYDGTTASSATVIANLSLLSTVGSVDYELNFTNGLTMVVNSTTADFTLVYD